MASSRRLFNDVYREDLWDDDGVDDDDNGYLATCQDACDAIAACIGISVEPAITACSLNGEGMKSTDEAAAESASGEDEWVYNYNSRSGSGVIAGTRGTSGYECFKKIGWRPGTPMRAPRLPAAHRHP